ncbi:Multimeric flavodoxin WrbA [Thalassobacillus cyri]|uniref:Multimeric flavodoxin WrbA n=1 Tax=Thalassobacillus cyri TaxID=571932 RepID=A0A1H4EKL4_9BACI|nr:NAD(P)H-dependent oxidoreductase [Thalassobacillus cyri]SEA84792.1 Multimeric flavodoxin WrbA [Thalassobacillus cyri]
MAELKALILNASFKTSEDDPSNTEALSDELTKVFDKEGVSHKTIRLADYALKFGVSDDLGGGDEWPKIFEEIKEADILVLASPVWTGEKSSLAKLAIERINGGASVTNDKGQSIYYNKVAGTVVTGNEDGAKNAAGSILYALSHLGFNIPPNVDAYWVGVAGPGPSYIEANGIENDFTRNNIKMEAYNLIHLARILKQNPIPAEGNVMED